MQPLERLLKGTLRLAQTFLAHRLHAQQAALAHRFGVIGGGLGQCAWPPGFTRAADADTRTRCPGLER